MTPQSNLTLKDWNRASAVPKSSNIAAIAVCFNEAMTKVAFDALDKFPEDKQKQIDWTNTHPLVKMYVLRMTELCFTGETIQAVADEMVNAGSIVDCMVLALEQQENQK